MKVTDEMVSRFLRWSLPETFRPDGGISFNRLLGMWPIGTNLFTAAEARAMLEYVLDDKEAEARRMAWFFHDTYEQLAPSFGYETRPETRKFDPDSPNGQLMTEVCARWLAKARGAK